MKNLVQLVLLTVALAGVAAASDTFQVPEINAGTATSALGVLAGALLVIRARGKR
jgi:hypothetical protein